MHFIMSQSVQNVNSSKYLYLINRCLWNTCIVFRVSKTRLIAFRNRNTIIDRSNNNSLNNKQSVWIRDTV